MLTYAVVFGASLITAGLLTPRVARWAVRRGWLDEPAARKVHARPTPRIGGIAVAAAFFVPLMGLALHPNALSEMLYADRQRLIAFAAGAVAILGLGVYDDINGTGATTKLAVQCLVAAGLWGAGFRIELLGNPFGETFQLGFLSLPLTMLWLVGVTNAFNLIDGLDGLAAGIAVSASVVLFGVAYVDQAWLVCLLMVALFGALLGFLFFNFNPARIFLGDSGSMFLGFILAAISVWTQRKGATAVALLIPVIALGVPILDTSLSLVRRLARRQNPFKADREHVHHRLLDLGMSHRTAVITLYTVSGVFSLGALALLDNDATRRAIVLSTLAVVAFVLVWKVGLVRMPGWLENTAGSTVPRDTLRMAARAIRTAPDADAAWSVAVPVLNALPVRAARWVLDEPDPVDPRLMRQTVYTWRRDAATRRSEGDWKREGSVKIALTEGKLDLGHFDVVPWPGLGRDPQIELAGYLLQDAFIKFAIQRRERVAEQEALVVRLAERGTG